MSNGFFQELRRRNVFRVAAAYVVTAWLLLQIGDVVFDFLEVPGWAGRALIAFVILGFPLALFFAWAFELTPEGLKRESDVDRPDSITPQTGRKLDRIIMGLLIIAVGYIALDKFLLSPQREAELVSQTTAVVQQQAENQARETDDRSIAVLPFVNMSADPEQEFFSDGLSEELLNVLAQIPGLRVAARTSSFSFKGKDLTTGEIAKKLRVAHVLEGSVRKSGKRIRITAQLIKAADGFHLWSETYDRELSDIFVIQDEIAGAITNALRAQLGMATSESSAQKPQVIEAANTQAYEAFLKGRQLVHLRGRENLEQAVRMLERALRLDDNYAPAHAQLAIATILLTADPSTYGDLTLAEVNRRATPHIDRALALAPALAEAHGARCLLNNLQDRYEDAVEDCSRALELNPNYLEALNWTSIASMEIGRYQESNRALEEVVRLDPQSIIGRYNYATMLFGTGRIDEGIAVAESLMSDSPWAGHITLGVHQVSAYGDIANGIASLLQAYALEPEDFGTSSLLARGFTVVGLEAEALRLSDQTAYIVNYVSGDYAEAERISRQDLARDPENATHVIRLADALHRGGKISESRQYYEEMLNRLGTDLLFDPENREPAPMLRLALARRTDGDLAGADAAISLVQDDLARRVIARIEDRSVAFSEALLSALKADNSAAIVALNEAIRIGMREASNLDEPAFADLQGTPEMMAVRSELAEILASERAKALQIICFNNPVPDAWQPLPETCAHIQQQ